MVKFTAQKPSPLRWRRLWLVVVLVALIWAVANPKAFMNLWLTPDQQGRLWFQLGDYERASRAFEDPHWRGFSLYAAQDFATAESYFSQFQDADSLLLRANALAHQMDYTAAKQAYEDLASRYPDHPAATVNLKVVEALIEADKKMSDRKANDNGEPDRKSRQSAGSSEGDEQQRSMELEQYSAEQLLQDPGLTEMWLRQIQRDPSEFLVTKFYLQLEQKEGDKP